MLSHIPLNNSSFIQLAMVCCSDDSCKARLIVNHLAPIWVQLECNAQPGNHVMHPLGTGPQLPECIPSCSILRNRIETPNRPG